MEHAPFRKGRDHTPGVAVAGAKYVGDFTAGQVATIKHRLEEVSCLCRKRTNPYLFFHPQQDARAQSVRFHKSFHEGDLIKTGLKEEYREGA